MAWIPIMNTELVVNGYRESDTEGESELFEYGYASKPGYIVSAGGQECEKKKGAPGGEFIPHPEYGGPFGEHFYATLQGTFDSIDFGRPQVPSLPTDERLLFWNPKKNTKGRWEDLMDLKIASTCEHMRRVGDGVPEWVEVADRREGDWMVPCVVLEGGTIVYPKNPKYQLAETGGGGEDACSFAPPYAWSSSGPPKSGFMVRYESGVASKHLLKSAIHAIKVASKTHPPAEAAEVDDTSSKKSERKGDAPAADGETPEKKPKVDSAEEKEKEKPISTLSEADFGTPGTH